MTKSKDGSIFDSLEEAAFAARLIKSSLLSPDDKSEPAYQSAMAKIVLEIEECIFSFCNDGNTKEEKQRAIVLLNDIHSENVTPINEKADKDEKQNQETEKIDNKPEDEQDEKKNGNGNGN